MSMRKEPTRKQTMSTRRAHLAFAAALLFAFTASLSAQGILTVTPSRTVSTLAGTGAVGYTADNGAAVDATLAGRRRQRQWCLRQLRPGYCRL
jgi:hypothetical protein